MTTVVSDGETRGPDLLGTHSAAARRFWESLRTSGQAQFFQPSDWSAAELVVVAIDAFVKKPQASMLASIQKGMAALLATEGDRRRVRVELEREAEPVGKDESSVSWLDDMRRRVTQSS